MAKALRHTDTGTGWIKREHRALWKALRESNAAKKLQAAFIGKGGITVGDGGGVVIKDNGAFSAQYPNGQESARFGPAHTQDGRATQALTIRDENGDVVFGANRTPYDPAFPAFPDGQRVVQVGGLANSADLLYVHVGPGLFTMDSIGTITLDGGPGGGVKIGHNTTADPANCVISSGTGLISRSTSSRRYKQNIEAAEVDVAQALKLTPRKFREKHQVADLGDDAPVKVGFIAEEAAALGLHFWVTEDDEGPEAFGYATWVVALQAIAQKQAEQIADLTARLEALEGRES